MQGSQELAIETALTLQRLEARRTLTKNCERLVLVLVGLPARGKSFLGRKLSGFLTWHGIPAKVFNVGKYRRQVVASATAATIETEIWGGLPTFLMPATIKPPD